MIGGIGHPAYLTLWDRYHKTLTEMKALLEPSMTAEISVNSDSDDIILQRKRRVAVSSLMKVWRRSEKVIETVKIR